MDWLTRLLCPYVSPHIGLRFSSRIRKLREKGNIQDWIDYAFQSPFEPAQNPFEIAAFIGRIAKRPPRVVLEIGTGGGGTLLLLCLAAAPDATIISVDLPRRPFRGGSPAQRQAYYRQFVVPPQRLHLLRENSHARRTLQCVNSILAGRQIDVLFIDGDHTYGGVLADWQMYGPLVASEGLIAFHDITERPAETGIEVHDLWQELARSYVCQEILANDAQSRIGIGLMSPKTKL